MRKPCQLLFFVQNILSKILGRVVLRRQLVEKLYFSKFRRELCLDANSASGHAEDRPADAHGANRRHQRVPPSTPQDLRRRGAEGAARRNVLRLPWQKRALLATASARDRDRRGRFQDGGPDRGCPVEQPNGVAAVRSASSAKRAKAANMYDSGAYSARDPRLAQYLHSPWETNNFQGLASIKCQALKTA